MSRCVKKACGDRATSARSSVSSFAVVCALLFFTGAMFAVVYFPVLTKSRISLVSRVSAVLIEYTSDM
jgi:hypothetical protein